jgi:short-subunit dehydrogenase
MNILVTGASQGIGFELVKKLSEHDGHRVMALSRNLEALEKLKEQCLEISGNEIMIVSEDLADVDFQVRMEKVFETSMPEVDILVNNAGSLINKPFSELEAKDFDAMFSVNVKGVFLLVRMLLPRFKRPAHIVNIGSMGGYQGSVKFPGLSLYSASKGALAILSECMAEEFKDRDIRVNCLALGSAQTEMLSRAFPGFEAPVTAAEMAGFIEEFCLSGHRFFNGKVLPVAVTTP